MTTRASGILLHPTSLPSGNLKDAPAFIDWLASAGCTLWQVLPLTIANGGSPYSSCSAMAMDPALADGPDTGPFDAPWLDEVARFLAIKEANGGKPWWQWTTQQAGDIDKHKREQARVHHQWAKVKAYAEKKGVKIIGDMPIYVDKDSADVWAHQDEFRFDGVSGVPPDYFSETGQLWGNPLYDWDAQKKNGHRFWVRRLKNAMQQTHIVRIDHFRAFSAYWAVPPDAKDARSGKWVKGPGMALFDDLRKQIGALPIIAEDLGSLDADVHTLRKTIGLPGMYVLQFAFGGDNANAYLPHMHDRNAVVYTGTHDNDTTLGWWRATDEKTRDHVRHYYGIDGHDIVWDLIRSTLASVADTAIIPAQDVLALGSEARMNTPGVSNGNWKWRLQPGALTPSHAQRLAQLNALYSRGSLSS